MARISFAPVIGALLVCALLIGFDLSLLTPLGQAIWQGLSISALGVLVIAVSYWIGRAMRRWMLIISILVAISALLGWQVARVTAAAGDHIYTQYALISDFWTDDATDSLTVDVVATGIITMRGYVFPDETHVRTVLDSGRWACIRIVQDETGDPFEVYRVYDEWCGYMGVALPMIAR